MEKYFDQMRRILYLTDTGIEALEYLSLSLRKLEEDQQPLYLLTDFMVAFTAIDRSIKTFIQKLPPNSIASYSEQVAYELAVTGSAFEAGKIDSMDSIIESKLLPSVRSYRTKLAECFNHYIIC